MLCATLVCGVFLHGVLCVVSVCMLCVVCVACCLCGYGCVVCVRIVAVCVLWCMCCVYVLCACVLCVVCLCCMGVCVVRLIYIMGRCAWVYASGNKLGFCERGSESYESKRDWFFFYSILYVYINIRTNKI